MDKWIEWDIYTNKWKFLKQTDILRETSRDMNFNINLTTQNLCYRLLRSNAINNIFVYRGIAFYGNKLRRINEIYE